MLEALSPQPVVLATKLGISLKAGTTYDSLSYVYRVLYPEMQHCLRNPRLQPKLREGFGGFQSRVCILLSAAKS